MNALFWDPDEGCWFDYDAVKKCRRVYWYPSNITPLWVCLHRDMSNGERDVSKEKSVINYMQREGVLDLPSGVPTSKFTNSVEQWDGENVWPPLVDIIVEALEACQDEEDKQLGADLARRYLYTTFIGYHMNQSMYEKYTTHDYGFSGCGGEYVSETGFGWSNGVALSILQKYGKRLYFENGSLLIDDLKLQPVGGNYPEEIC